MVPIIRQLTNTYERSMSTNIHQTTNTNKRTLYTYIPKPRITYERTVPLYIHQPNNYCTRTVSPILHTPTSTDNNLRTYRVYLYNQSINTYECSISTYITNPLTLTNVPCLPNFNRQQLKNVSCLPVKPTDKHIRT